MNITISMGSVIGLAGLLAAGVAAYVDLRIADSRHDERLSNHNKGFRELRQTDKTHWRAIGELRTDVTVLKASKRIEGGR